MGEIFVPCIKILTNYFLSEPLYFFGIEIKQTFSSDFYHEIFALYNLKKTHLEV